uniref:Uncharacterized protein n=1 Tax=Anguilla anguilla TaxID=7936 RepID=A0A0E9X3A1_ANGAN
MQCRYPNRAEQPPSDDLQTKTKKTEKKTTAGSGLSPLVLPGSNEGEIRQAPPIVTSSVRTFRNVAGCVFHKNALERRGPQLP